MSENNGRDAALKELLEAVSKTPPPLYLEEIENHFDELFEVEEGEHLIYHEIVSPVVHLDVHLLRAGKARPFHVLYTTGMSDLPMKSENKEIGKEYERAELYCIMPHDMDFPQVFTGDEDKQQYRIISAMKKAARYPHLCGQYLSHCHSLQFSEDNTPFSPLTEMCGAVFYQLDHTDFGGRYGDGLDHFITSDGTRINFLCFVPIYKEEMEFKLKYGAPALYERLFGEDISDIRQLEIHNDRRNVCLGAQ